MGLGYLYSYVFVILIVSRQKEQVPKQQNNCNQQSKLLNQLFEQKLFTFPSYNFTRGSTKA